MGKRVYLRERSPRYDRYRAALARAGLEAVCQGPPEDCDGLLLPGGGDLDPARYGAIPAGAEAPDLERDREEWELLQAFTAAGKPVLGICRGLQVINVFFGGTLVQDLPGHGQVSGADSYHRVVTAPGLLWDLYGPAMTVNSAHHQAVDRLGRGLVCWQQGEDGVVEALGHKSLPVWAVQWHPERLGALGQQVFRAFAAQLEGSGKSF